MLKRPGSESRKCLSYVAHRAPFQTPLRYSSTLSNVAEELISRPLGVIYDYLSPTPSHLLDISLADFLHFGKYPRYPTIAEGPASLPQGHHIVYFPPPAPHHELLSDGTDTLHSPAAPTPFTRRLWAGGSVTFNPSPRRRLALDGACAACVEGIRDVTIKGKEGEEKIFVHIERRIGYVDPDSKQRWRRLDKIVPMVSKESVIQRIWEGDDAAVVEKRNLVFLRKNEEEDSANIQDERAERIIKPLHLPNYAISLTPAPSLLFRFSALTFNAHAIHLDRNYTRAVEGHRNLLVHGPLSLVLMLTLLRSRLRGAEMVKDFSYRNLAPLFADEEMRVCLRSDGEREENSEGRWDVWIEGKAGGYAVKGSATIGKWEDT